jgi:steroid delta-isomerase
MPTRDQILDTIERYIATFGHDREGWLALFTEDATIEDPVGTEIHTTPDARAAFWDMTHSLADDIELRPAGSARVAGGEAAFAFTIVTDLGGQELALDAIDVMTFAGDGRITGMRAFWDMDDMRPLEA